MVQSTMPQRAMPQSASLPKRLASCVYEFLLLIALWMLCTLIFVMFVGDVDASPKRLWLQIFLWLAAGAYFVVCWHRSGQTLAAQAWKIKLVNVEGNPLNTQQAVLRYVFSSMSLLVFGVGFFWALVDKDQLFLHDRLLNTRLTRLTIQKSN